MRRAPSFHGSSLADAALLLLAAFSIAACGGNSSSERVPADPAPRALPSAAGQSAPPPSPSPPVAAEATAAPAPAAPGASAAPAAPEIASPKLRSLAAEQACKPDERVLPRSKDDLAWMKRVTDELKNLVPRSRLACLFGLVAKPSGDMVELTPHSPLLASARILNTADEFKHEAVSARFPPNGRPLARAIEKLLGPGKKSPRVHFDSPDKSIIYITTPEDVSVRAILTLADDPTQVDEIYFDLEDLRGWTPKPIRCYDGAQLHLNPPRGERFPQGKYSITAAAGGKEHRFTCSLTGDILMPSPCSPTGKEPPAAAFSSSATSLNVHVPGDAPEVSLKILVNGVLFAQHVAKPNYRTSPAVNVPSGQCKSALEFIRLERSR